MFIECFVDRAEDRHVLLHPVVDEVAAHHAEASSEAGRGYGLSRAHGVCLTERNKGKVLSNHSASFCQTFLLDLVKALTVADYKRTWFDARRAELHAKGLKDVQIAEQMGIKRAYFSQIVNGLTVSDQVVDRMTSAFGFKFLPVEQGAERQTPEIGPTGLAEAVKGMAEQARRNNDIIDLLVTEVRSLREQLRTLKEQR